MNFGKIIALGLIATSRSVSNARIDDVFQSVKKPSLKPPESLNICMATRPVCFDPTPNCPASAVMSASHIANTMSEVTSSNARPSRAYGPRLERTASEAKVTDSRWDFNTARRMGFRSFSRSTRDTMEFGADTRNASIRNESRANPAKHAASLFQQRYQTDVLRYPGKILATREALGLTPMDLAIVDIGGEGAKTDLETGILTGNVFALNLNAQIIVSSSPILITDEPGMPPREIKHGLIPNLVRPAEDWQTRSGDVLTYPLADEFADLTMMEGVPLYDNALKEVARIAAPTGWIVLAVAESFEENVRALALLHNGGMVWDMPTAPGIFPRKVIPPAGLTTAQTIAARERFGKATSHELHEVVRCDDNI